MTIARGDCNTAGGCALQIRVYLLESWRKRYILNLVEIEGGKKCFVLLLQRYNDSKWILDLKKLHSLYEIVMFHVN